MCLNGSTIMTTGGYNKDVLNFTQIKNIIKEFSEGEQSDLIRPTNN